MRPLLLALAVSLCSAPAALAQDGGVPTDGGCAAQAEAELPTLPTSTVEQNGFALTLTGICGRLTDATCSSPAAPSPKTLGTDLEAYASNRTRAPAQLSAMAHALTRVCRSIQGKDGAPVVNGADLELLATLRKDLPALAKFETTLNPGGGDCNSLFGVVPQGTPQSFVNPALEALGTLQSNLINGLAQFVVTRAKAEAQQYLAQRLQETICSADTLPFFRNTCVAFSSVDAKVRLAAMGAFLKSGAQADLRRMPELLAGSVACVHPGAANELAPVRAGLAFFRESMAGRSPLELSRSLRAMSRLSCEDDKSCQASMRLLRFTSELSAALQSQGKIEQLRGASPSDPRWGTYAVATLLSLKDLIDEQATHACTADAQCGGSTVCGGSGQCMGLFGAGAWNDYAQWFGPALRLAQDAVRIGQKVQQMRDDANKRFGPQDRAVVVAEVLGSIIDGVASAPATAPGVTPELRKALGRTRLVFQLGERLAQANDSAGDLSVALLEFGRQLTASLQLQEGALPQKVKDVLPLLVELANAESSDEVAKTLEAAAAPVGSYTAKYEGGALTVNAFLGGTWSRESIAGVGQGFTGSAAGVFAPVGLHASYPFAIGPARFHLGAMLSLVDVGNLASVRIKDELAPETGTTSSETNVTIAQVFSPGLYATLGLFHSPLVIGGGFSMVPNGRTVELPQPDGSTRSEAHAALRLGLFIAIDLTLFQF